MTNKEKHAAMIAIENKIMAGYAEKSKATKELLPSEPFFSVYATPFGWIGSCQAYSWISATSSIDEGPEVALSRAKDAVQAHLNPKQGA